MQITFTVEQDGITINEFDREEEAREYVEDLTPTSNAFGTYEITKWEREDFSGDFCESWSEEIREITPEDME